jgi:hypothetical protein
VADPCGGPILGEVMDPSAESPTKRAALLTLKVIGAAAWLAAYREAIAESRGQGRDVLPHPALVFNLTWEAIYTIGGLATWRRLTIEDKVQTAINASWLVSDSEWARLVQRRAGGSAFHPGVALAALGYHAVFLKRYPPGEAARLSAMWQNLGFSAYCALHDDPAGRPTVDGVRRAYRFTLFRTIGTAVPTLTSGLLRGVEPRYLFPGLGCGAFDALRLRKERRRSLAWDSQS